MINKTAASITRIYTDNLNVRQDEKVLVFTDDVDKNLKEITSRIARAGKVHSEKTRYVTYRATGNHGVEPPEVLWRAAFGNNIVNRLRSAKLLTPLLKKKTDTAQIRQIEHIVTSFRKEAVHVIIALSYYSTSHTRFRYLLTNICGTRYASMPLFDKQMLRGAMMVDWKNLEQRTKELARNVNKGDEIEIKTPNGTYITLSKKGRRAREDTGIITKKGAFSNLPAGEVFLAPLEKTAEGRLVLEWAPTHRLKHPVTLYVEKGMVKEIQGNDNYADYLRRKIAERRENANIAELGIGTNDRASRPDNILESEKILGTIHIALGDNSSFGGRITTPFHQDFVFFKPTLTVIDKKRNREVILKNGKLSSL